jgi:ribosomal protein L37AE/L43A
MLVFLGMIMDDWKCAKGIPWTAHEPNARADTLIYMVFSDYVCEHKMVMVEANSFYGASELGPSRYSPLLGRDVYDKAEKTRSPFEGGCKCNETEAPKDTPSDEGIFKCSECGSKLGSPHEKKCAYL